MDILEFENMLKKYSFESYKSYKKTYDVYTTNLNVNIKVTTIFDDRTNINVEIKYNGIVKEFEEYIFSDFSYISNQIKYFIRQSLLDKCLLT